jgi:hypothetical protein
MNYVLGGGGFTSRLVKVVRSEGGKTYHVSSAFEVGRESGAFEASTFTRTAETTATLKLVLDEIAKMRDKGPTDEELKAAKNNLIGGYGLRLETGGDLAEEMLSAEIDGLDPRYVAEYPARLDGVTAAAAARAAAAHLDPRALVVVGKAAEVGPMRRKAGFTKIEVVNYLDPVSGSERKQAQASRAAAADVVPVEAMEGRRLLDVALQAKGGAAALAKVKALAVTGKGTMTAAGQAMPVTLELRERVDEAAREDLQMGPIRLTQIFVPGKRAIVRQGDKQMDMPAEMKAEMEKNFYRDPNFILLHAQQPAAKLRGLKPITDGGVTYDAFEIISPENEVTRLLLDPKTHLIAKMMFASNGKQVRLSFGDYRILDGVSYAFKLIHDAGDEKLDMVYDKIEVNPKLAPELFQ